MNNFRQYQEIQIMTADRVRIVIMLYEGVLRFNKCAQKAMEDKNIAARTNFINRSLAIISELSNSLNMEEGGEIAGNLARLYDFAAEQLMRANMRNNPAPLEVVNRIMTELKAGWEAIATDRAAQPGKQAQIGVLANGL
ncbi:MAG: flagellar export chaperone FliS [Deltaproteobacteria bacterium]|nr:flagellar export chaperone FliS [Deltaproteobacteria bacterium]